MKPIYLDYNATTPIDPRVAEAIRPFLDGGVAGSFGNPSSSHAFGHRAHDAVEVSRASVAELLGARSDEIVFTGCGSEADNLALVGVAEAYRDRGDHLIISQIEHPAILNTCRYLERRGYRVTYLPVDGEGRVSPDEVEAAITDRTILVSIMHANNETGVLQPIAQISARAHRRGILMHTDAAQSVGKIPTRVDELGVDLLTVAGHKIYAPKGIGALYVRSGVRLEPLVHGAGHESGRRAGTENVPYIVGLGSAATIASNGLTEESARLRGLRDRLFQRLSAAVPGLALNGHQSERLPNTLNLSFPGVDGEELLAATSGVAASTGSACHAGRTDPSAVLLAMGLTPERALGAVRLSLGRFTDEADVDRAAAALTRSWRKLSGSTSGGSVPVITVSVDLAYKRYADMGVAVLTDRGDDVGVEFIRLADRGLVDPPNPARLAQALFELCRERGASVLLLDGPQAWKDPENGLVHQRICERTLLAPAKTGLPGQVKPAAYGSFVQFSIAVFDALRDTGARLLVSDDATLDVGLLVLESFPFAAWKGLGLRHLPAKGKVTADDVASRSQVLVDGYRLVLSRAPSHDELQALIAGLAGVAIGRDDKLGYRVVGVPLQLLDGFWREGYIVIPCGTVDRQVRGVVPASDGRGSIGTAIRSDPSLRSG